MIAGEGVRVPLAAEDGAPAALFARLEERAPRGVGRANWGHKLPAEALCNREEVNERRLGAILASAGAPSEEEFEVWRAMRAAGHH